MAAIFQGIYGLYYLHVREECTDFDLFRVLKLFPLQMRSKFAQFLVEIKSIALVTTKSD